MTQNLVNRDARFPQSTNVPAEWEGAWEFTRLATLRAYLAEEQKAVIKVSSRKKWCMDLSSCTPKQLERVWWSLSRAHFTYLEILGEQMS